MNRYFVFIVFLVPFYASAQNSHKWTLNECIEYAKNNDNGVKQIALSAEECEVSLNEAKWAFVPDFFFVGRNSISSGRVLDETTYDYYQNSTIGSVSTSLSGSLSIFTGLKRIYNIEKGKLELLLSNNKLDDYNLELKLKIISAYVVLLHSFEKLDSEKLSMERIRDQERIFQDLLESGRCSEFDLLHIQELIISKERDIIEAEKTIELARLDLSNIVNAHIDDVEQIAIELNDEEGRLISVGSMAFKSKKEVAEREVGIAKLNYKIAKTSYYPTMSLSFGLGSNYSSYKPLRQNGTSPDNYSTLSRFGDQLVANASSFCTLNISVPIFQGKKILNVVRRAKMEITRAENNRKIIDQSIEKEYMQLLINYQNAKQLYVVAKDQLLLSEKIENHNRIRYEEGRADYFSWKSSILDLQLSRNQMQVAKYQLLYYSLIIRLIQGESYSVVSEN